MRDNAAPWDSNAAATWGPILTRVGELFPNHKLLQLRQAEVAFALGESNKAAGLLPAMDIGEPPRGQGLSPLQPRSRLLGPGLYEHYLIVAYQALSRADSTNAIEAFHWAFSLAPEYVSETDYRAFYSLMSDRYAVQAGALNRLRAGQYALWADRLPHARQLLHEAMADPEWSRLTVTQQAHTWTYLARSLEATSNEDAIAAYRRAISLAPTLAEPRLRLLAFQPDIEEVAPAGPTYRLEPPVIWGDHVLVGYDVEEAAIGAGGLLDLWVWWQKPSRLPGWSALRVRNLAPNPGLEWGIARDGLPVGYYSVYPATGASSVLVNEDPLLSGNEPHRSVHITSETRTTIRAYPWPADPAALYLSATWVRSNGKVAVGRKCFEPEFQQARNNLWIVPHPPLSAVTTTATEETWRVLVDVGPPVTDQHATLCQLYLEVQEGGSAFFARPLVVRLPATLFAAQAPSPR